MSPLERASSRRSILSLPAHSFSLSISQQEITASWERIRRHDVPATEKTRIAEDVLAKVRFELLFLSCRRFAVRSSTPAALPCFSRSLSSTPLDDHLTTLHDLDCDPFNQKKQKKPGERERLEARHVSHDLSSPPGRGKGGGPQGPSRRPEGDLARPVDAGQVELRALPGDQVDLAGPERRSSG